jgi:Arc/MetJ family transcription regulator
MRTTLDLPEDLLKKAMKKAGLSTKTAVIVLALEELIRKESLLGLKRFKGKIDLDVDLDLMRGRN